MNFLICVVLVAVQFFAGIRDGLLGVHVFVSVLLWFVFGLAAVARVHLEEYLARIGALEAGLRHEARQVTP